MGIDYANRNVRDRLDLPALRKAIVRMTVSNPEMAIEAIAAALGCSHVTVRKWQRRAGVYVVRGPGGRLVQAPRFHRDFTNHQRPSDE